MAKKKILRCQASLCAKLQYLLFSLNNENKTSAFQTLAISFSGSFLAILYIVRSRNAAGGD